MSRAISTALTADFSGFRVDLFGLSDTGHLMLLGMKRDPTWKPLFEAAANVVAKLTVCGGKIETGSHSDAPVDVPPVAPSLDVADDLLADAKPKTDLPLTSRGVIDFQSLRVVQLGAAMVRDAGLPGTPAFAFSITGIVAGGAKKQMPRIDARRVVAAMANEEADGNLSVRQFPSHSTCSRFGSNAVTVDVAPTFLVEKAEPQVATAVRLRHPLAREAISERGVSAREHLRTAKLMTIRQAEIQQGGAAEDRREPRMKKKARIGVERDAGKCHAGFCSGTVSRQPARGDTQEDGPTDGVLGEGPPARGAGVAAAGTGDREVHCTTFDGGATAGGGGILPSQRRLPRIAIADQRGQIGIQFATRLGCPRPGRAAAGRLPCARRLAADLHSAFHSADVR